MTSSAIPATPVLGGDWPCVALARRCTVPRVPFRVRDGAQDQEAGSVAHAHLEALARWPEALAIDDGSVTLTLDAPERDAFFAQANARLHEAGLIVGWRHETYPVLALSSRHLLATFERAASRFWGTLTLGAPLGGTLKLTLMSAETLPCAIRISGGTVNAAAPRPRNRSVKPFNASIMPCLPNSPAMLTNFGRHWEAGYARYDCW